MNSNDPTLVSLVDRHRQLSSVAGTYRDLSSNCAEDCLLRVWEILFGDRNPGKHLPIAELERVFRAQAQTKARAEGLDLPTTVARLLNKASHELDLTQRALDGHIHPLNWLI